MCRDDARVCMCMLIFILHLDDIFIVQGVGKSIAEKNTTSYDKKKFLEVPTELPERSKVGVRRIKNKSRGYC